MLTERVKNMVPSVTVEMTAKVAELKKQGVDIIAFNIGEPDFNTPDNIIEAAKKAMDSGFTKYTAVSGLLELREAICKKFIIDNNVEYKPNEIIVSTGAKQALMNAVLALCNPGDEVIVPKPCWVSYIEMIKLADGVPVLIETREEDNFEPDIKEIEKVITGKTVAIILNTPNNPTGAVYSESFLRELGELAVKNNFYVISDEIYEKLVYDGEKHICMASLSPEIKEKAIVINGMSKAYAMTGWRIGYAAGNGKIIKAMNSIQGHTTSNTNSIAQKASIEALTGPQYTIENMRQEFDKRRKYLFDRLTNIKNIDCAYVKGAFYLMPNVSKLYGKSYNGRVVNNSVELSALLLDEANIAVIPGDAFEAPNNIRISYSNSIENIEKGINRMEKVINMIK